MSDTESYWAVVEQSLRDVHAQLAVRRLWDDVEVFVQDQMDLVKACYASGYYDAMDDTRTAVAGLEREHMKSYE